MPGVHGEDCYCSCCWRRTASVENLHTHTHTTNMQIVVCVFAHAQTLKHLFAAFLDCCCMLYWPIFAHTLYASFFVYVYFAYFFVVN